MDEKTFINALSDKGIQLSAKQETQFELYYRLLVEWNKKINLTAITDKHAVYLKHFYDSISPRFFHSFQPGMSICDIGAGAGFPSLPILITIPGISVTIVESLKKRVNFLDVLVTELELDNVELIHARAEDIGRNVDYRESFSIVTARAVARLSVLSELCLPLCKTEGIFIAMKGANAEEELKEAEKAYRTLGGKLMVNSSFELPGGEGERSIICIEKVTKTPKKYPRKAGVPGKNPL